MQVLQTRALVQHYTQLLTSLYDAAEAYSIVKEWLWQRLNITQQDYLLDKAISITNEQQHQLRADFNRLLQHEPWQYIVGKAYFYDMELFVTSDVLIPRPETEELVHNIAQFYKHKPKPQKIIDICTGSGCIAIALKKLFPDAKVIALDVSEKALQIAKKNAERQQTAIQFECLDILEMAHLPTSDLIVSNPPYVTHQEKQEILPNVLQHEPHLALFVPDEKPLLFYEKITKLAIHSLKQNGLLAFELNDKYATETAALLRSTAVFDVELLQDLHNKERMLLAVKK